MAIILETSLGDITCDLYPDERPTCCKNFLKLCKIKYYNCCLFHSVQRNLAAQTGDPSGKGIGGHSVFGKLYGEQANYFEAEIKPRIKHKKHGTLSMVNNGEGMHGSQFFITLAENVEYLDQQQHTVFGEVAEGFEVLDKINEAYTDKKGVPYQDIRIYHTIVLDDPFDDPAGLSALIPDRSPEPTKEQLDSGRIGADEDIDDLKGMSHEEIEEMMKERQSQANAQILTMVGDLPSVDVEAPDTILFVCKLNPVTTSEDLEIIFSRFGEILSCEVIKDQKTEESLQYAFIEFSKPSECENAYFKMDNVLIDDRRIHVDFSQSVSKLKKYKNPKAKDKHDDDNEEEREKYVIRDRSKKDHFDLIFSSEDETQTAHKKKKNKKDKKSKRERDEDSDHREKLKKRRSPERDNHRGHKDKHTEREDRSPSRDRQKGRERSPSRDRQKRRERSPSKDRQKGREISQSRDRQKRRERSPSRDRRKRREISPSRDRQKGREISPSRDRQNGREKSRSRDRMQGRRDRSRSREQYRDFDRIKEKDRYRDKDRRERERSRDMGRDDKYRDRSRERYREKDKYRR